MSGALPATENKNLTLQVATKAVIEDDSGAVLLLKRSKPYHGQSVLTWDLPGGRIDPGESLEQALRRELKEETDLELGSVGGVFHIKDFIIKPESIHVVRITFRATASGSVSLGDEHVEHRWVLREDLPLEDTTAHLLEAMQASGWV